jgi:hypothetical protein
MAGARALGGGGGVVRVWWSGEGGARNARRAPWRPYRRAPRGGTCRRWRRPAPAGSTRPQSPCSCVYFLFFLFFFLIRNIIKNLVRPYVPFHRKGKRGWWGDHRDTGLDALLGRRRPPRRIVSQRGLFAGRILFGVKNAHPIYNVFCVIFYFCCKCARGKVGIINWRHVY